MSILLLEGQGASFCWLKLVAPNHMECSLVNSIHFCLSLDDGTMILLVSLVFYEICRKCWIDVFLYSCWFSSVMIKINVVYSCWWYLAFCWQSETIGTSFATLLYRLSMGINNRSWNILNCNICGWMMRENVVLWQEKLKKVVARFLIPLALC